MFLFLPIVFLLLCTLQWIVDRKRRFRHFEKLRIPGPKPNFFFGNLWELRRSGVAEFYIFERWKRSYGDIFGYYSGTRPVLVVTNLDLIRQILIKDFNKFHDRPKVPVNVEPVSKTLVGLRGQRWTTIRRLLAPAFSNHKLQSMSVPVKDKVQILLDTAEEHATNGESLDFATATECLSFDVICECALALPGNSQKDQTDPLFQASRTFLEQGKNMFTFFAIVFPPLANIFAFLNRHFASSGLSTCQIIKSLRGVLEERRQQPRTRRVDVLQVLVWGAEKRRRTLTESSTDSEWCNDDNTDKVDLSDDEIIANAWVFLLGGFDTTAHATAFTIYLLAKYPHVQEKLLQELKEHIPLSTRVGYQQLRDLQYLTRIIRESMRLYPPVESFVMREAACDVNYPDVKIPQGTLIQVPLWIIHRNPEIWPQPEHFDPDRFLAKNCETRHPMAYMPFGAGRRSCIGQRFAMMEMKITLATLLRNYRLEMGPDTPEHLVLTKPTVSLHLAHPLHLRIVRRTS